MSEVLIRAWGPLVFWREVALIWRGKTFLSWEDWDYLFEFAREKGALDHYEGKDGHLSAVHEALVLLIVRQRRRVLDAREMGFTAEQFHDSEQFRVRAEKTEASRKQQAIEDARVEQAAARRQGPRFVRKQGSSDDY
jgi:hypothetical protein